MEKAGLLDVAIAPLHWLERSKGWKRRGLVVLYGLIAATVGLLGWREISLWRLPNIREPFDEARLGSVVLAEADNAIPLYRAAEARLKPAHIKFYKADPKDWEVTDWAAADPEVRRWVDDNRPALESWLLAVDRPDCLLVQPREMTISTRLGPIPALRDLARLAILEGSRLERSGDPSGAWRYYRGVLRSSRHAGRHGETIQRLVGYALVRKALPAVKGWIDNPAVTTAMLRRAIRDVEEAREMTPPNSDMVIAEYYACRDALDHPEDWKKFEPRGMEGSDKWYNHVPPHVPARHFLFREPERSHRINRLITAGILAQCDRPRAVRPKLAGNSPYLIYDIDAATPPAVASLTPEELTAWADRSAYSFNRAASLGNLLSRVDFERAYFDDLAIQMAQRAYRIDHGKSASTFGDLLGPYLKALPDGFEPGDATGSFVGPQ